MRVAACDDLRNFKNLGGHFSPEKKCLAPPKIAQFAADTLPAPRPLPLLQTPFLGFSINTDPRPFPGTSDSPFPLHELKKIKNIRNVHQEMVFQRVLFEDIYSSKTKALQIITLQVLFLLFFLRWNMSAQGINKNMLGNYVPICCGLLPALTFTCSVTVCSV